MEIIVSIRWGLPRKTKRIVLDFRIKGNHWQQRQGLYNQIEDYTQNDPDAPIPDKAFIKQAMGFIKQGQAVELDWYPAEFARDGNDMVWVQAGKHSGQARSWTEAMDRLIEDQKRGGSDDE